MSFGVFRSVVIGREVAMYKTPLKDFKCYKEIMQLMSDSQKVMRDYMEYRYNDLLNDLLLVYKDLIAIRDCLTGDKSNALPLLDVMGIF